MKRRTSADYFAPLINRGVRPRAAPEGRHSSRGRNPAIAPKAKSPGGATLLCQKYLTVDDSVVIHRVVAIFDVRNHVLRRALPDRPATCFVALLLIAYGARGATKQTVSYEVLRLCAQCQSVLIPCARRAARRLCLSLIFFFACFSGTAFSQPAATFTPLGLFGGTRSMP